MLFYNFDSLDNFIKNNLIKNIESELSRFDTISNLYQDKKNNLDNITTNIVDESNNIDENKSNELFSISSTLKNSFEKLDKINSTTIYLKDSLLKIKKLYVENLENNYDEIKAELIEYNTKYDGLYSQIFDFENDLSTLLSEILELYSFDNKSIKKLKKISSNPSNDNNLSFNIEEDPQDNNILIVSEKNQKAYLPYRFNTIKKIFEESNGKYKNLQDVIDSLYVLPLNKFKSSSIARFREAFYLVRHKEKDSVSKALDLASELMFKHELNPIIISACRNLDELDIYLDCLEENELNQFKCFEIRYEVSPKNI